MEVLDRDRFQAIGGDNTSWERCRFLTYTGSVSDADFRDDASKPATWIAEVEQVICGLEIPFLPEPFTADLNRSSRGEVARQHRRRFRDQFARVVGALYTPALYRAHGHEWSVGHHIFDLRLLNNAVGRASGVEHPRSERGRGIAPSQARILILVRVAVRAPTSLPSQDDRLMALGRAATLARKMCRQIRALAPRELTLRDIHWCEDADDTEQRPANSDAGLDDSIQCWLTPAQAWLGECDGDTGLLDIRRAYALTDPMPPLSLNEYERRLATTVDQSSQGNGSNEALRAMPYPLPTVDCSLMATLATLTATEHAAGLSLRLRPTAKTGMEIGAMIARAQEARQLRASSIAIQHLLITLHQEELFHAQVQVASTDRDALTEIASTYIGEHHPERPANELERARRLTAVVPLVPSEQAIAAYNLGHLEFMPWGSISNELHERSLLAGRPPTNAPSRAVVGRDPQLKQQETFLSRDNEADPALMRLRGLITLHEANALWRLPVVEPGGQAGINSRLPNPYEQLPEDTPEDGDAISMGVVQHRGRSTGQHFRLPLLKSARGSNVAGIGDRVIMVAGSPGSGKTNFAIFFLGQLWDSRAKATSAKREKYPYLVIDPTRGNEFRQLLGYADPDLLIFTVGDSRSSAFRFNPFIVPRGVSVQTHVSRLMSCFKAAYHMWDPLPAIFEMAIKRAYEGRRTPYWQAQHAHAPWVAADDFPATNTEPFPDLDDVIGAMGRGSGSDDKPEIWEIDGRPTVMSDQRTMWGGQTENAATIVASTFLRLHSLRGNFGHILGVGDSADPTIDVSKLLERPVILEMGMVGDSQALSLIMAFLLVCLRGTIESTGPELKSKARAAGKDWMHMLVVEEAHILLSGESSGGGKEAGNSKAQAAEDINNMLAEVRKYGQGVMLLDQRPGSLVGGAIDNAYVICMHRLNEEKSFQQFSQLLNLTPDQQRFARTELRPGEMITLDRRSGLPALVRPANERTDLKKVDDQNLHGAMLPRRIAVRLIPALREGAVTTAGESPHAKAAAEETIEFDYADLKMTILANGLGDAFDNLTTAINALEDQHIETHAAMQIYKASRSIRKGLEQKLIEVTIPQVLACAAISSGRPRAIADVILEALR